MFFIGFWYNLIKMGFEYDIIKFLQANATSQWISFFQTITMLGSFLGFFITFILVFIKNKKLSIALAVTFVVASVFNHFLKAIVSRARPFDTYTDIINYGNEDGFSFPSGHSLCAGMFATFLFYTLMNCTKNKWTIILGGLSLSLLTILIALSRMVLGVHYLTDTIIGIFMGILFAIIGILLYNTLSKKVKKRK